MHVLQTNIPVVRAWQVAALLGSIALVVLGAYGTLILQNRSRVNTLWQRLFGAGADESDDGFVETTSGRLTRIEQDMEKHDQQTHTQLYKLDQKMDVFLEIVAEEHESVRLPRAVRDVEDVPPPPEDFYGAGDTPSAQDRGQPGDESQGSDD
jgi:hypothetical protein